jgi:exodeoxyribonuclease VII small subunit
MKKKQSPETFDARLARLQEIVALLEAGALPLEEGLALYKEGMGLSKACREQLERARHEILLCTETGPQPFEPESEADDDGAGHG